jgi:hypothetical protein
MICWRQRRTLIILNLDGFVSIITSLFQMAALRVGTSSGHIIAFAKSFIATWCNCKPQCRMVKIEGSQKCMPQHNRERVCWVMYGETTPVINVSVVDILLLPIAWEQVHQCTARPLQADSWSYISLWQTLSLLPQSTVSSRNSSKMLQLPLSALSPVLLQGSQ